ncbi:2-amino-4-hydroxy-6-hydroxymethyldihydropteridine diphosphokinase [Thalassovita sp.]|uniref:2-amino-4-hydroxy-6- hydroxymethyldihydropteridine diphosphokinase n=1 Tax=Thalassovita sp. TaxID=1979401 RepID=UPI003B5AA40C
MQNTDQVVVLALGSNQSLDGQGPEQLLRLALAKISASGVRVLRTSRFYETPCFPAGAGPDYVNAVVVVDTRQEPGPLLELLHKVEANLGRQRDRRWGARTVDIDLIAHGQRVLPDVAVFRTWLELPLDRQQTEAPQQLILPHPRLQDRAFVLVPMLDVAPDWSHPVLNQTTRQLCESLPKIARDEVKPI